MVSCCCGGGGAEDGKEKQDGGDKDDGVEDGLQVWALRFVLGVAGLGWWMLFMTAIWFHTWLEKVSLPISPLLAFFFFFFFFFCMASNCCSGPVWRSHWELCIPSTFSREKSRSGGILSEFLVSRPTLVFFLWSGVEGSRCIC